MGGKEGCLLLAGPQLRLAMHSQVRLCTQAGALPAANKTSCMVRLHEVSHPAKYDGVNAAKVLYLRPSVAVVIPGLDRNAAGGAHCDQLVLQAQ